MKIGFILFNGITWLDFIGIYDPISRLKTMGYISDLTWDICCLTKTAADHLGLTIVPTHIGLSLASYHVIIVPGGKGARSLQNDPEFMAWIRTAETVPLKISICTGSLILGAAGFLTDRLATTNYNEYPALEPYCKQVLQDRIVEDRGVITAGAVSASIDLGLYLCEKWSGSVAQEEIRKKMDYHPSF